MYYIPVATFFKLLRSPNFNIRYHLLWALSNISGDCEDYRKKLCTVELMERVLQLTNEASQLEELRSIAWYMTNFTSNCKNASQKFREKAFEILKILMKIADQSVELSTLWSICSLTTGDDNEMLIFEEMLSDEFGVLDLVSKNISRDNSDVLTACIRICVNITASNDEHTQIVIDEDILSKMMPLIRNKTVSIRKEVLLIISNISASSVSFQIDYIITQPIFKEALMLINDNSDQVRYEASWIYNNLSTSCNYEQLLQIISLGVLDFIKDALKVKDPNILIAILKFLEALLRAGKHESEQAGDTSNQVAVLLDESQCLNALENCQDVSEEVYNMIGDIIETYYGFEDESNSVPIEVPDGEFDFS